MAASNNIYPVTEIIGKTLIANRKIDLYRGNQLPNGNSFAYVNNNQPVGVVYSYVTEGNQFFWMFLAPDNSAYYAPHGEGYYDISALQQQGALTTAEIIEQIQQEENSFFPNLPDMPDFLPDFKDIILPVGLIILGAVAIKKLI